MICDDEEEKHCRCRGDKSKHDTGRTRRQDRLNICLCTDGDGHEEGNNRLCILACVAESFIKVSPDKSDKQRH